MLTILADRGSRRRSFCDGISRRGFLKVGGMALGGLSLPQLLRAEEESGIRGSHKALINIYLPGGPSHIDMWDLKPDAPREIRGEFRPIPTSVPGIEICELFPQIARRMERFAIIRSIADADGRHDAYQCMTGRTRSDRGPRSGWPAAGAWVSHLLGPADAAVPPHLAMMYRTGNGPWGDSGGAGFLGVAHSAFNLAGKEARRTPDSMVLQGITLERLRDRERLRRAFDGFRRQVDTAGTMESMDVYLQQALGILTTSRLADALDLSKEDPRTLERYGRSDERFQRDGAPKMVENFCIARRLVEAGARVVSLNYSRWDWHGGDGMNFPRSREEFPLLDQGVSALVDDLHARGLDCDVSVVVWGEFGRTPKINKMASRDHWPQVSCALLAGGGMRTGQVIGRTNRFAESVADRPVRFQEVFATLYHNLGLDPAAVRVFDATGTPQYVVDPGIEPLRELV